MPLLQIVASRPFAGKTAVAAGTGLGLSRAGARVRFFRSGSGEAAEADARTYAEYLFASSPGTPVAAAQALAQPGEIAIIESDAGPAQADAPAILVTRGPAGDEDVAIARALGDKLIGSIATAVAPREVEAVARDLTNKGLRPMVIIPEDRALAAPSVAEIKSCLAARVLYQGENDLEVVEDVLIAPVYADPAQPHFRRFASKAVLAPFNKTDLHLAAIETQAACLVITGGHDPSPYVLDRAQHGTTTVLLSDRETPETLASLSQVWLTSRFRGDLKAEAVLNHLSGRIDFANLAKKLES
jgi:BioD-like phosphotransacetylase family protein